MLSKAPKAVHLVVIPWSQDCSAPPHVIHPVWTTICSAAQNTHDLSVHGFLEGWWWHYKGHVFAWKGNRIIPKQSSSHTHQGNNTAQLHIEEPSTDPPSVRAQCTWVIPSISSFYWINIDHPWCAYFLTSLIVFLRHFLEVQLSFWVWTF